MNVCYNDITRHDLFQCYRILVNCLKFPLYEEFNKGSQLSSWQVHKRLQWSLIEQNVKTQFIVIMKTSAAVSVIPKWSFYVYGWHVIKTQNTVFLSSSILIICIGTMKQCSQYHKIPDHSIITIKVKHVLTMWLLAHSSENQGT